MIASVGCSGFDGFFLERLLTKTCHTTMINSPTKKWQILNPQLIVHLRIFAPHLVRIMAILCLLITKHQLDNVARCVSRNLGALHHPIDLWSPIDTTEMTTWLWNKQHSRMTRGVNKTSEIVIQTQTCLESDLSFYLRNKNYSSKTRYFSNIHTTSLNVSLKRGAQCAPTFHSREVPSLSCESK